MFKTFKGGKITVRKEIGRKYAIGILNVAVIFEVDLS